jgi:hypothetical protein
MTTIEGTTGKIGDRSSILCSRVNMADIPGAMYAGSSSYVLRLGC